MTRAVIGANARLDAGPGLRRARLAVRLFDSAFAGAIAILLAFALGLPWPPALVLALGTGLLASSLCATARRSGPSLVGVLLGGLLAGTLAAAVGLAAWAEVALIVAASLLATRVGRSWLTHLRRRVLRAL